MTTLQVHCNLSYISLHALHDLVVKIPNSFLRFLKDMYKQQRNFFFFLWIWIFCKKFGKVGWNMHNFNEEKRNNLCFFCHVSPAIPGYLWSLMLYVGWAFHWFLSHEFWVVLSGSFGFHLHLMCKTKVSKFQLS